MAAKQEDEDDYMSMTFNDVGPAKPETSLQRAARLKKEASERSRVLSKAAKAAKADEDLKKALAIEIDSSNKGAEMMRKMGFKGGALGKTEGARTRPIELNMKDDRSGIGMESDKKRKLRKDAEGFKKVEKHAKLTVEEYRERNRLILEENHIEKQKWDAMKTLEDLETRIEDSLPNEGGEGSKSTLNMTPLRSVNVLWRPLVKDRMQKEHARRVHAAFDQSLSLRSNYNDDPAADKQDQLTNKIKEDLDENDPELEAFEKLSPAECLEKILAYLRDTYHYCFWCKHGYPDETMDGCPGVGEDEHG